MKARRTARAAELVHLFGHGVGGRPGERLLKRIGTPTSDDTILRHLKRRAKANRTGTSIRVVGLDDWASRKGSCVCRKPYPSWWSERIGYPGGI